MIVWHELYLGATDPTDRVTITVHEHDCSVRFEDAGLLLQSAFVLLNKVTSDYRMQISINSATPAGCNTQQRYFIELIKDSNTYKFNDLPNMNRVSYNEWDLLQPIGVASEEGTFLMTVKRYQYFDLADSLFHPNTPETDLESNLVLCWLQKPTDTLKST